MPKKAKDEELNIIKKSEVTKKAVASKKVASKKVSSSQNSKNTTKKNSTTPKSNSTKKTSNKISSKKSVNKITAPAEYYDLPTAYNKTLVKILAQTPSCLFVYWEISEKDKLKLQKEYGEGFFKDTKPYLVIINETMNYSFEIEINDYANSWYINIHDSNCKYSVKLIRKSINNYVPIPSTTIDIMSSNEMNAPNDHILFDTFGKNIFFKNVQTDIVTKKDISSISFVNNIGKIYNLSDFYKQVYKNELTGDELGSNLSSSSFSSFFK